MQGGVKGVACSRAPVGAEHGGDDAVGGRALEALAQRAEVAQVHLLGALHRGALPARRLQKKVQQAHHRLQAALACALTVPI